MVIVVTAFAIAATVLTCGAATPFVGFVASATLVASSATIVNGGAEIAEAATGYNVVRDGFMGGDAEFYNIYRTTMQIASEVGGAVCGTYYVDNGGEVCFVAGTLVSANEGLVPIEDIKVGDLVWASDPETGETALKEVVRLFRNETTEWVHVKVGDEEIVCTPTHPFYSPEKGWVIARELRVGDVLVTLDGSQIIVERIYREQLIAPEITYNFEVEGFHTYYVGSTEALVHNKCGENGKYEDASYHTKGNSLKSARPTDGQAALDNSVQFKSTSSRRVGTSNNQFVVLDETRPGMFHGHVRPWKGLDAEMQNALVKAGMATRKGKIK